MTMLIYILKSALTLTLLYGCFVVLLSRETLHHFNRCVLLGILASSLIVPLIRFTIDEPSESIVAIQHEGERINRQMNSKFDLVLTESQKQKTANDASSETAAVDVAEKDESLLSGVSLADVLCAIYIIGVFFITAVFAKRVIVLVVLMRGGLRHTDKHGNTVILLNGDVPPFSLFRFIVMSVDDYEHNRAAILTHEQEHIRLRHTLDIIFLEIVRTLQWFNPFVWLLARDLQAVHEYEADEAVLNKGIDEKTYQLLLVTKAVGNRLQPFANNLRHSSLKKRIIMMKKTKSRKAVMLKALIALPVLGAAMVMFACSQPKENANAENTPDTANLGQRMPQKPLVVYWPRTTYENDSIKPNYNNEYHVNVPLGGLVEIGDQMHLENMHFYVFSDSIAEPKMMLDGELFDHTNIPDLKCSALKKLKIDDDGERAVVNIITKDVMIPDTVKTNMPDTIFYTVRKDGGIHLDENTSTNERLSCANIPFEHCRLGHFVGRFYNNPNAVAILSIENGSPAEKVESAKQMILADSIFNVVTKEVDKL